MSSIAVTCGLIILVLLVIMLLAGVPIAVALAVSSIAAILPVLNTGAAVLTGAQRIFSGISVFKMCIRDRCRILGCQIEDIATYVPSDKDQPL